MPTLLHDVIAIGAPGGLRLNWKVAVGQMVKEGDIVAEYNAEAVKGYERTTLSHPKVSPQIVMPHSGKIISINPQHHYDWKINKDTQIGYRDIKFKPEHLLFSFQYYASDEQYGQIQHPTEPKAPGMNLKANGHPYAIMLEYIEMAASAHGKAGKTQEPYLTMWEPEHPFKMNWAALWNNSKKVERVENGVAQYEI